MSKGKSEIAEKAARRIYEAQCDRGRTFDNSLNLDEISSEVERAIAESQAPQPRDVSMQMLVDARLNAFGLQLFCESFADGANAGFTQPFSFKFRGLKFTVERIEGEQIDTTHH